MVLCYQTPYNLGLKKIVFGCIKCFQIYLTNLMEKEIAIDYSTGEKVRGVFMLTNQELSDDITIRQC